MKHTVKRIQRTKRRPVIKIILRRCECCKKELKNPFGTTKYCSSCAVYIHSLITQIGYYKNKSNKLALRLYGCANGAQRIKL